MEKLVQIDNKKIILKEAEPKDKEKILNFLNFLFPHKKYDENWFKWIRHLEGFERDYYIGVDEEENILAIYGFWPLKFKLKNKVYWASQVCNIGVHPNFWGSGLFKEISFFSFEKDRKKGRSFAFCSPRRVLAIRGHKNLGFKEFKRLFFYEKKSLENSKKPFDLKKGFLENFDIIFSNFYEKFDFSSLKNKKYLLWRYSDKNYDFFSLNDLFFITKHYIEEEKNIKRFHFLEIFYKDLEDLKKALLFFEDFIEEGFALHTWAPEGSLISNILESCGFEKNGENCPLLICPYDESILKKLEDCKEINLSLGDDEAF